MPGATSSAACFVCRTSAKRYVMPIGGPAKFREAAKHPFDAGNYCCQGHAAGGAPKKKGVSLAGMLELPAQTPIERCFEAMAASSWRIDFVHMLNWIDKAPGTFAVLTR